MENAIAVPVIVISISLPVVLYAARAIGVTSFVLIVVPVQTGIHFAISLQYPFLINY